MTNAEKKRIAELERRVQFLEQVVASTVAENRLNARFGFYIDTKYMSADEIVGELKKTTGVKFQFASP